MTTNPPSPDKQPAYAKYKKFFQSLTPMMWAGIVLLACLLAYGYHLVDEYRQPEKVVGKGIIMNQNGRLFTVNTKVDGIVIAIPVSPGDEVKKGQLVVEITDHEYELKLAAAKLKVENLSKDFDKFKIDVSKEGAAQLKALKRELLAKKFNVQLLNKKIPDLEAEVTRRMHLYDLGLISPTVVRDAEDKLSSAKIERETTQVSIANIQFNLLKGYRTEELKSKERDLTQATEQRNLLELQQKYYKIHSPWDGRVLELMASEGEIVKRGSNLLLMEGQTNKNEPSPYRIYAYLPVEQNKQILVGQKAVMVVYSADPSEYGVLIGKVAEVSDYPISRDSISKVIYNKELVNFLVPSDKAVVEVVIDPDIDPLTKEYKWSKKWSTLSYWTGAKPPPLTTGTLCTVTVTIKPPEPKK